MLSLIPLVFGKLAPITAGPACRRAGQRSAHYFADVQLLESRALLSAIAVAPDDTGVQTQPAELAEAVSAESQATPADSAEAPVGQQPAAKVAPADFSGTWNVSGELGSGTLAIQQNGKKVTGTVTVEGFSVGMKGKVKGDTLRGKFNIDVPGFGSVKGKFQVQLQTPTHFAGSITAKVAGQSTTVNIVGDRVS
jgi:hypothetical protein